MVKDSIDIQPPFAKKKREFVSRSQSIYTQRREFNRRGLLEKEIWELDNGKVVIVYWEGFRRTLNFFQLFFRNQHFFARSHVS